jgi:hypothetical protein
MKPTARGGRRAIRRGLAAVLLIFFVPLGLALAAHFTDGAKAFDWHIERNYYSARYFVG